MAKRGDDYSARSLLMAATVLAALLVLSFIPPLEVWGLSLRRASIFSDLVRFDDDDRVRDEAADMPEIDVEEFHVDLEQVAQAVAQTTAVASPTGAGTSVSWEGILDEQFADSAADSTEAEEAVLPPEADYSEILPPDSLITPIENFGTGEPSPLERVYEKLLAGGTVRIAFMGDSFVEGDILTADLRELLQDTFGGGGVGFVPVASPFTGFRQTVKTTSKGWTPYNIMQRKSVPEPYADEFFVSGWVARATDGASTRWDMTQKRRHLDECRRARLMFISRESAEVSVKLNDGEVRDFEFEGSDVVRQIVVEEERISSLEMTVGRGSAGFIGYGADFDDTQGVSVDNLSVRSNNGQAMFRTDPAVNAQINGMRAYDVVILQYGLNIMQADRRDYSLYAEQVQKMIRFVESCFPSAAVVVMGVSDRSQKNEDGIVPMESARDLSRWQRKAAEECGAAFWNTYDAMQLMGGMTRFVANGWAGKDYTHINYAGGAQVARALYHAILRGAQEYSRSVRERIERSKPVITEPLLEIEPPIAEVSAPEVPLAARGEISASEL